VDLETAEKHLDVPKDVDERFLARSSIFGRLRNLWVTLAHAKVLRIHTERRMPTPAKIMLAGEKTCHINMREHISAKRML
jgi:hypothetical protein